jgi:pyridoxamine 5'-phosphate oxidase
MNTGIIRPDCQRRDRLLEADLNANPHRLFDRWLQEAVAAELHEPFAMTLATATPEGKPSARIVLLRGWDERGFVFYTSYEGRKAAELEANPHAALVIHWAELERQVRIEGEVERTSAAESDAYFQSRPAESRLAACAARQSVVLPDRAVLEASWLALKTQYPEGDIPRPPTWGGYRVTPSVIEFWQGGPHRLHDRFRYTRAGTGWTIERLAP